MTKAAARKKPAPAAEAETADTGNALISLEAIKPQEVFVVHGTDKLIAIVEAEVESFKASMTVDTEEGRKAIWHFNRQIAASKNGIDKMKKEFTEARRAEIDAINAEGKRFVDRMEEFQEEINGPLEAWKKAEADRIGAHKERLEKLRTIAFFTSPPSSAEVAARLKESKILHDGEKDAGQYEWEEFAPLACEAYGNAVAALQITMNQAEAREAQEAELAALRKEKEEREAREREETAAKAAADKAKADADAAAEKARRDAEERVKAEGERAAKAELEAQQAREREAQAIKDKEAAEANAKKQAEESAERARLAEVQRQEAEKAQAEQDAKDREADKAHRARINREALADIMQHATLTEAQGIAVLTAIAKGHVKHIKIAY